MDAMILEFNGTPRMSQQNRTGRLILNRRDVGSVLVRGNDGSWTFGEFTPGPEFSRFAAIFGRWSLLMHAESAAERLSEAASEELRLTEYEIDAIRAFLRLEEPDEHRHLRQLNIDGTLIEWKE
jgi:hypothetical protein